MSEPLEEAAALAEAGKFFEAAEAYEKASDPRRAFENLMRLSSVHPSYREACRRAVRLAVHGQGPTLAFENLVAVFVRSGPSDEADFETFRALSDLYEEAGFPENAVEVLQKIVGARPNDSTAAERLAKLHPRPGQLPGLPELKRPTLRVEEPPPSVDPIESEDEGPPFRVGALISDRYRLEERIGSGGMSVVFRATDITLGDAVAIKVLTQGVYDQETDKRLRRELLLTRRVTHPNVLRVFDIGLAHGFRFISMELLAGHDLRSRLRGEPLPTHEGFEYLIQTCRGLEAAHAQGIVHRDVKPENCFITKGSVLKLMDFGLAKVHEAGTVTSTGMVAGTPAYMAPEQVMDFRQVGPLADIYSVGVMAYEIFTGALPFDHSEPIRLMLMHMNDQPPAPRARNPAISRELERTILDCLAKNPKDRVPGCAELAKSFEAFRDRRGSF